MEIREVTIYDSEEMLNLFEVLDSETDFMIFEPNERVTTLDEQESILTSFVNESFKVMFVAHDKSIVGFCALVGGQQNRTRHVASLVIGVKKSHWGKSLASKLIEQALSASQNLGIKRVELTVHINNKSAINLYKKYGFSIEGERVSSINQKGNMLNEYYMAKV